MTSLLTPVTIDHLKLDKIEIEIGDWEVNLQGGLDTPLGFASYLAERSEESVRYGRVGDVISDVTPETPYANVHQREADLARWSAEHGITGLDTLYDLNISRQLRDHPEVARYFYPGYIFTSPSSPLNSRKIIVPMRRCTRARAQQYEPRHVVEGKLIITPVHGDRIRIKAYLWLNPTRYIVNLLRHANFLPFPASRIVPTPERVQNRLRGLPPTLIMPRGNTRYRGEENILGHAENAITGEFVDCLNNADLWSTLLNDYLNLSFAAVDYVIRNAALPYRYPVLSPTTFKLCNVECLATRRR